MSLKPGEEKSVMLRLTVPFVGCAYDINDCNLLTFNINMLNNKKPMCVNTPVVGNRPRGDYSASNCLSKVENTDWNKEQFTNFTIQGVGLIPTTDRSYLVLANFVTVTKGDHAIWENYRTPPYEVNTLTQVNANHKINNFLFALFQKGCYIIFKTFKMMDNFSTFTD